ncbi:hypothetical protein [uncultured Polaribacter sp.]|uniref:hypothetical protein n=1 Tax=uncultured Polaribacter sp. TaxID=174711 RepID=UPI002609A6D3|nr:hypothetical protein [uncultured Polaribacter sp.]
MMITNWTKIEFETYVLLYAAHCNHIETEEEQNYILSKLDEKIYNKIHTEKVLDNDSKSLHKIQSYLIDNNYSYQDKELLLKKVKEIFFADGSVDILEKKVFTVLKKILS